MAAMSTCALARQRNAENLLKLEEEQQMRAIKEYARACTPGAPSPSTVDV